MSYNKWFPHRPDEPRRRTVNERRGVLLRVAWYASLLMLMAGYVLMFVLWDR